MRTRTKSALLLAVVLFLGVAIGILVAGALHNRRLERIAHLRTGPGIAQLVERAVRPESEEQREQIRAIMEEASPRFADLFRRTQEDMRALSDSVMSELEAILSPEQMEELRRHMDLRRGSPSRDRWTPDRRPGSPRPGGRSQRRPPPDTLPVPPPGG
jgi:hypothetical protein